MGCWGRLYNLVFRQHCVPWRVKNWFANHFPRVFIFLMTGKPNVNTAAYWDGRWKDPNSGSLQIFCAPNKFGRIAEIVGRGSRVLDVGCGVGILLDLLKDRNDCECTGVDISPHAIEVLRSKGHGGAVAKPPFFPYPDSSFDYVIATELIEHLSRPRRTIAEMARVAASDGKLIVSTPNAALSPIEEKEHLHSYDAASLNALLAPYLRDIRIEVIREQGLEHEFLLATGTVRKG